MVIDHPCKHNLLGRCTGPIQSIRDVGSPLSVVWLKFAGIIGGKSYSLMQVENFLRAPAPFAEDSRLHACIVCASISCPNLRSEAFRANKIDDQMSDQVRDMLINDKKGFHLDKGTQQLTLSKIYQWYDGDFSKETGSVIDFIMPFISSKDDHDFIEQHRDTLKVEYFEYDWNANGKVPCNCSSQGVAQEARNKSCLKRGFSCAKCMERPCCCEGLICDTSGPPKCEPGNSTHAATEVVV